MMFSAIVTASDHCLVATLSDGRQMEADTVSDMAKVLHFVGVQAHSVRCEWHAGQRMMTAGQRVALIAALRSQEGGEHTGSPLSWNAAVRPVHIPQHLSLLVCTEPSFELPSGNMSLAANNQGI